METLKKQHLFWDVNLKEIDLQKSRRFIIERILSRGDLEDLKWASDFYGKELIKNVLINNKSLDAKSQNFWCLYFNVDKSKCIHNQLIKKQSVFWRR
jgi:hypothetical protein